MLSINTNLSSLITQHSMKSATQLLNQAVERMTTGYKINHAKDNAANYSIATNLTTKINSYMVAEENCAMGLDLLATANGSLNLISDKLTRLRDLATQASNGTYGQQSLNAINAEANALVDEIERLYSTSEYNGKSLLQVTPAESPLQTYSEAEIAAMTPISETTSLEDNKQYSISSADDLKKLAEMVNHGVYNYSNSFFVLTDDINLAGVEWTKIGYSYGGFQGTFDGNGHTISNLTINETSSDQVGFLGYVAGATIKNLKLENVNVSGLDSVGGLFGDGAADVENCSVSGNVQGRSYVGGLAGSVQYRNITNSSFEGEVVGRIGIGGFIGKAERITISNSYANTTVSNTHNQDEELGGFIGYIKGGTISNCFATGTMNCSNAIGVAGFIGYSNQSYNVTNSYSTCEIVCNSSLKDGFANDSYGNLTNCSSLSPTTKATQMTLDQILATYTPETLGFTEANGWYNLNGQLLHSWDEAVLMAKETIPITVLQVGINSDSNSQISMNTGIKIDKVGVLRGIGNDTSADFLTQLDTMLATVNSRQTELGAIENRLTSALDEISIQYENLVSSRSTIRDADIAEVSSEYIRQQILQQASATLMATANQSPSIALQLI